MKTHSKELWTKLYLETSKSKQQQKKLHVSPAIWFIKGVLFLSKTENLTFVCHFLWKQSISFARHKEWLLWQSLHAVLPRGFEFRAAFRREFECLASCNSLREAEPRLLELQPGFFELSFISKWREQLCVFTGHFELLKPPFALIQTQASETEAEHSSHEPPFLFWSLR